MKLTEEQELVLKLCEYYNPDKERILELVKKKLDWSVVLGHLTYNRVAGLAYYTLSVCGSPRINREFSFGLYMHYEIQKLRTKYFRKAIKDISIKCNEANLSYAFLKGSILANSIFASGCRVSNDIDLLVNGEDLTKFGAVLKDIGFIQGNYISSNHSIQPATRIEIMNSRINYGEVIPYLKLNNEDGLKFVEVDLNFSLDWKATGTEEAVSNFLKDYDYYTVDGYEHVKSLSLENFLIHLCVHLYKEAIVINWVEGQRDLGLYKFVDIYALIFDKINKINWDKLKLSINENGLEKECYYTLFHTAKLFPSLLEVEDFNALIAKIKPSSTAYLDIVIDAQNADITYHWDDDFLTRFFDLKRYNKLSVVQTT